MSHFVGAHAAGWLPASQGSRVVPPPAEQPCETLIALGTGEQLLLP